MTKPNPDNLINELELQTISITDLLAVRDQVTAELQRRGAEARALLAEIGAKPPRTRKPRSDKGTTRKEGGAA